MSGMGADQYIFSVITVVRNDLNGFRRTAESVLGQSCRRFEWIVIDGDSSDGTAEFAKSLGDPIRRIRVVSEQDAGIYDAMNKGLSLCVGQFVVFLNAGDTFYDAFTLSNVGASIEPGIEFIYGDSVQEVRGAEVYKRARSHSAIWYGMIGCHQSMYYKRAGLDGVRFDLRYKIAGDYDLTARFLRGREEAIRKVEFPLCRFDMSGLSNRRKKWGRRENDRVQRVVLGLSWLRRRRAWLGYLISAVLQSASPALYVKIRSLGT